MQIDQSTTTIADLVGPWVEPGFESSLISRCRSAWDRPIDQLSDSDLAMLLRQRIAVEHLLIVARSRLARNAPDGSEYYDGELANACEQARTLG
jgi:hypothetical protein